METHEIQARPHPWEQPWPEEHLQSVGQCPVCGATGRRLLHDRLVDNVFRAARGEWRMWECSACASGYLDPRPTPTSIHMAYANYYTHQPQKAREDFADLSRSRKVRRVLANGYTNWRFGTDSRPSSPLGIPVMLAAASSRRQLDHEYRNLPASDRAMAPSLLDIGCGNGSFLRRAKSCGWSVTGIEPDPSAAAAAATEGLDVLCGGLECFDGQARRFDAITLSHVIEHVHEPAWVVRRCHDLLKPGGQIWLETPNIHSYGHSRFGESWRGIETPRHLVLFNRDSLSSLLREAGFRRLRWHRQRSSHAALYRVCQALQNGGLPSEATPLPVDLRLAVWTRRLAELFSNRRSEFLTVTALRARS